MKKGLDDIQDALTSAREATEDPNYRNIVSSASKTALDAQRISINTAFANVTDSQQTIASTKLSNESDINTAQAAVSKAKGQLIIAQDNLALLKAEPSQPDIDLYRAQIKQSEAKIQFLENQIQQASLKSPTDGEVTRVNKRAGEMVQPILAESIISLLPASPFEIEVNIYEEEIVKVGVGDPVNIFLIAFPDQIFQGKVLSIDPAEKLIEGVVYYKVTIGFTEEPPKGVKPGMTTDITIITETRDNVLLIPEGAIYKKGGKMMVKVWKNGTFEEKEIEVGLKGSNNMVEVVSGLTEGEKVVLQ